MKYALCLLFLISCAHKITTDGGQAKYDATVYEQLGPEELPTYAQTVVRRETRDPDGVSLAKIRKHPAGQIRRAALVVFETELQPSRSGLATDRNVYLSPRGKQILTNQFFGLWEAELRRLSNGTVKWTPRKKLFESKAFVSGGSIQQDYVLRRNAILTEQDIFWRQGGQKIPEESLLMPPNFRDLSLVLVPATQFLATAKPSQHQHHWVNDLAKELELDAVIVVYLGAEWRRGGVDKRSQAVIPEEMQLSVDAAVLYPWSRYHQIGEELGKTNLQKVNVPLASYHVKTQIPVTISLPEGEETTKSARKNIIMPLRTTMVRLSTLVIERLVSDILQTHQAPVEGK